MEPSTTDVDPLSRNQDIANMLNHIGSYYSMEGDTYRAKSFLNASTKIANYPIPIINGRQARADIKGIGASIADEIDAFLVSGTSPRLQELEAKFTDRKQIIDNFMSYYGIGPVSAVKFYNQGFRTLEDLWFKANLTDAQKIGIMWRDHIDKRIDRVEMDTINAQIGALLNPYNIKWAIAGSYRRNEPSSGDIDILVQSQPDLNMDGLIYLLKNFLPATLARGPTKFMGIFRLSPDTFGHRIDIRLIEPKAYPFALLYFTGSQRFNILMRQHALTLGMTLNEYGLYTTAGVPVPGIETEADIFTKLGLNYVEPEMRTKTIASL